MGFGVWGYGVWGLGFGVWGLGFGVWGLGFRAWGLGIPDLIRMVGTRRQSLNDLTPNPTAALMGLGFRVEGLGVSSPGPVEKKRRAIPTVEVECPC